MRAKTETKRQAITDVAMTLFREMGYERTSMAAIAALVGGSKTTLYGYFKSKEELFVAAMEIFAESHSHALIALLDPEAHDIDAALRAFGRAYLELILSPLIISMTRLGISESDKSALSARVYENGSRQGWTKIGEQLQRWVDQGRLHGAETGTLARHLQGLLETGMLEPSLYGVTPPVSRGAAVDLAVDAFLRAYGG